MGGLDEDDQMKSFGWNFSEVKIWMPSAARIFLQAVPWIQFLRTSHQDTVVKIQSLRFSRWGVVDPMRSVICWLLYLSAQSQSLRNTTFDQFVWMHLYKCCALGAVPYMQSLRRNHLYAVAWTLWLSLAARVVLLLPHSAQLEFLIFPWAINCLQKVDIQLIKHDKGLTLHCKLNQIAVRGSKRENTSNEYAE